VINVNSSGESLGARYLAVRQQSLDICEPLEIEDHLVQPMDDASPPKWHLAHVTWFFETFLLKPFVSDYKVYDDAYEVLFNSYYNGVGEQHPRSKRGLLSRPTLVDILDYRRYVDEHMRRLLEGDLDQDRLFRVVLGLHHEQQHQELLYTDIKYNFGNNPLLPPYSEIHGRDRPAGEGRSLDFVAYEGGIYEIGVNPESISGLNFAFDNESPRHEVLVGDFAIADRPATNGEFLAFMNDGGYERPELWLSDAWGLLKRQRPEARWGCPLYWFERDGEWFEYTLRGVEPLAMSNPVCHVSAYEADAFARWKGMRLPTEQEWEVMASDIEIDGNFAESGTLHPGPVPAGRGVQQVFGDVWEWTASSYSAYPGFKPFAGALGEYNGKFMANQLVLRGGSCATPRSHIRRTYRNFFYPKDRWQFSGIRLAAAE